MFLVTIQTSQGWSQDPEPRDAASFLSPFHSSNSYWTHSALSTPWETLSNTWLEPRCPALPQLCTKPGSNQFDQALFVPITWLHICPWPLHSLPSPPHLGRTSNPKTTVTCMEGWMPRHSPELLASRPFLFPADIEMVEIS